MSLEKPCAARLECILLTNSDPSPLGAAVRVKKRIPCYSISISAQEGRVFYCPRILEKIKNPRYHVEAHLERQVQNVLHTNGVQIGSAQLEFDAGKRLVGGTVDHRTALGLKDRTVTTAAHVARAVRQIDGATQMRANSA
jgi:hypothetical protein